MDIIYWIIATLLTIVLAGSGVYLHYSQRKKYNYKQLIAALVFLGIVGWTVYRLFH